MQKTPLAAAVLAGMMALMGTGCDCLAARDHLNKGVASTKAGKFGDAAEHFKQAMALDPDWDAPRLYLAVSYMSQWIPGAESPENQEFAKLAKEGFLKVLETSPNDTTALASMASMSFSEATTMADLTTEQKNAKLDESAEWHKKHIAVTPTAEHYYSLAVIGYTKWVKEWIAGRQSLKMRQDDPGPIKDKKVRDDLKERFSAILDQGVADLQKSLELDPEYENSMAYMNLMVRERADLLDDKAEYDKATTEADAWLAKYLETKKIKAARAAKSANSGIVQDAPK